MIRIYDSKFDNKSEQKRKAAKNLSENFHIKKCQNYLQKIINLEAHRNNEQVIIIVRVTGREHKFAADQGFESSRGNFHFVD